MLAQRERAINAMFAGYSGKGMSDADLVRNLLLSHIEDDQERQSVLQVTRRASCCQEGELVGLLADGWLGRRWTCIWVTPSHQQRNLPIHPRTNTW